MDNVFLDGLLDGRGDKAKGDGLFHLAWNCKIHIRIRRVRA
jgi:hypothetical protein